MEDILGKLVAGLLGALIVWLTAKYYFRSRLYCAPSRLYEYSHLVDGSSTVQLVIANRGRKTEELVEVQLSTDYEYTLLAATQNGIEIPKEKIIRLPALLPKSEVSMIVVAEGKPRFSREGIRSIRSKSAIGSTGASLTEAEASTPGAVPTVLFALFSIALAGYGFGKVIGEPLWTWGGRKLLTVNAQEFNEGCVTVNSNGVDKAREDQLSEDDLRLFALGAIRVSRVSTLGDTLVVDVDVENRVDSTVEYSVTLNTSASDSSTDWHLRGDKQVYDIVLSGKGEKRSYSLSNHFPIEYKPKRFWLESRVEIAGYWVSLKRSFFYGEDEGEQCPADA